MSQTNRVWLPLLLLLPLLLPRDFRGVAAAAAAAAAAASEEADDLDLRLLQILRLNQHATKRDARRPWTTRSNATQLEIGIALTAPNLFTPNCEPLGAGSMVAKRIATTKIGA